MSSEAIMYDKVVQYIKEWVEEDGNSLMISLADHETGGLAIGRNPRNGMSIVLQSL